MQAITQRDGARNDQAQGLEDLVQVEQFDFAARLAPLTVVLALVAVQVAVVLFWAPNGRAYFLWLDAYCVLMAGVALVSAARWRNGQKPERLEPRTLRITTVVALGAGLALASIPIVLFGEATAQERALILAMCAGLIGTGMSLAVLPRVALAFSGPIVVATAVVLRRPATCSTSPSAFCSFSTPPSCGFSPSSSARSSATAWSTGSTWNASAA